MGNFHLTLSALLWYGGTGWECDAPKESRKKRSGGNGNVQRSARRAGVQLRRLCHCMDARYFVTLTVDARRCDRYDVAAITRKLSVWADNQVRRKGLCYILVPELHKDGALHYHGIFNAAWPVVDSGTISRPGKKRPQRPRGRADRARWLSDGGHVVYNLPSWPLGFTTAIELYGGRDKTISYVSKYVSKQRTGGKVAGRWYYHGGAFSEPVTEYYDVFLQDLAAENRLEEYHVIDLPEAGYSIGVRGYRKDEEEQP